MEIKKRVSSTTRRNWILDSGLFLTALIASLSGIYFLIFPEGGYKGGRNPYYGIQIIFEREGWEWIHTWISFGFIAVGLLHLIFHWKWVVNTTSRIFHSLKERKTSMNKASRLNVLVDGVLGLGFLICALSGVYLFVVPEGKNGLGVDPMILFSRTGWDLVHTWSGVAFISAAIIHFGIHWGWVVKVARKMFTRKAVFATEQMTLSINQDI